MKTYTEYENLIVDRLAAGNDFDISPLPLIDAINEARVPNKPRIYVIYAGSSFDDSNHLGEFGQNETLSFKVYIRCRTRDGELGVFEVAEEAVQRLMKWRPINASEKISITSFQYVQGIQNNWQYELSFSFPRVRVAREEPNLPEDNLLIKEITHNIKAV